MGKSLVTIILGFVLAAGVFTENLDPGRITWWKESWTSSGLVLSSANAGSGITLTVRFRLTTAISTGVLEIGFPSGVTHSSLVSGTYTLTGQTFSANTDFSVDITNVQTSAGVLGPFSLLTRDSTDGQIRDLNQVFGSIAVAGTVSPASGLTVGSSVTSAALESTQSLNFDFILGVDLWRYDILEIESSSYYTPADSIACSSTQLTGPTGTDLPCELSNGKIVVYGLSQDFTATANSVRITVESFLLPSYSYTTGYSWTLRVYRFGTTTLLTHLTSTDVPITLQAEAITLNSWTSKTGYGASNILANMELFTDITFTMPSTLPTNAQVLLTFSGVDISTPIWYYGDSDKSGAVSGQCVSASGVTCTVTSATGLTLAFPSGRVSGQIELTTLTQFVSSPTITSVVAQTSAGDRIAEWTGTFATFTIRGDWTKLTSFDVQGDTDSNLDAATGRWSGGVTSHLFFYFEHANAWTLWDGTDGTKIEVHCPVSETSVSFTEMYINTGATWNERTSNTASTAKNHGSGSTPQSVIVDGTAGSFTVQPIASSATWSYAVSASTSVALPVVQSNKATFYECWVLVSTVSGGSTTWEADATRFSVVAPTLSTFNVKPICQSDLAGIPLVLEMTVEDVELDMANFSFELELTVQTDLDLGITSVPIHCSDSSVTATGNTGSPTTVTFTGFQDNLSVGGTLRIYLPNGVSLGTSSISNSAVLRYTDTVYGEVHEVFKGSGSFTQLSSGTTLTFTPVAQTLTPSQSATLAFSAQGSTSTNFNYVGITAPQGFDLSGASLTYDGNSPTTTITLTSSDPAFKGNAIIGLETASFAIGDSGGSANEVSLQGVQVINAAGTMSFSAFEAPQSYGGATPNGYPSLSTCLSRTSSAVSFSVTAQTMASPMVSVSSCQIRGPGNFDTTMSLVVPIGYLVPTGGLISVVLSGEWSTSYAGCTSSWGSCSVSGQTVTVTTSIDVPSGSQVEIDVSDLQSPTSGSSGTAVSLLTSASSTIGGAVIESVSGLTLSCLLESAESTGQSVVTLTAIPNAASVADVDFYFTLRFTKSLPVGSNIDISLSLTTWKYANGFSLRNQCWSSLKYSSCDYTSNLLRLILAEKYTAGKTIDLYLDSAINMVTTAGDVTSAYTVTASKNGVTIIQDSNGYTFTVGAKPSLITTGTSAIALTSENIGELSDYTFKFTISENIAIGDEIYIKFPRDYDPYLGEAYYEMNECTNRRTGVKCSSSQISGVCYADHWNLQFVASSGVNADTEIELTVFKIKNSGVTGVSSTFYARVLSGSTVTMYTNNFGSVSLQSTPSLLNIKSVAVSNTQLSSTADYTFQIVIDGTVSQDTDINIVFPKEYNFNEYSLTTVECSGLYYQNSLSNAWISNSNCTVGWSNVTFSISTADSRTFTSTDIVEITLKSLPTPHWGLSRTEDTYMYDTVDSEVFTEYSYWTSRFTVYITNTNTNSYWLMSYPQQNSAYLGFEDSSKSTLKVNNYDPRSQNNRLLLYAGTQSSDVEISVENWLLSADSIVFTPSLIDLVGSAQDFEFSSLTHNFTMYQWIQSISFRVAVPQTALPGLYYISWSLAETTETGVAAAEYTRPASTMLEVCTDFTPLEIIVSSIPELFVGNTSIPIKVKPALPPSSDLKLSISFSDTSANITASPSELDFQKEVDELYFNITIGASYDIQAANNLVFALSGTNAASYSAPSSVSLIVFSSLLNTNTPALSLQASSVSLNSATISIVSSNAGVLYWWLGCENSTLPTNSSLIESASSLLYPDDNLSLEEQLKEDYQSTEVNLRVEDEDIRDQFWREYATHCSSRWVSSQTITAGTHQISLDWLYAETTYSFAALLSTNLLQSDVTVLNFTTTSLSNFYSFTAKIDHNVTESDANNIKLIIADWLGINPLWLHDPVFTYSAARRLQTSTAVITWELLYDRAKASYDSEMIANQDENLNSAKEQLVSSGIASSTNDIRFEYQTIPMKTVPFWQEVPALLNTTDSSISFNFSTSDDGVACGICNRTSITEVTPKQVLVGLTGLSEKADSWECTDAAALQNTFLTIGGVNASTTYHCYFTVCSDYPLWPECFMDATNVTATTGESISLDLAAALSIVVLYIFN